MPRGSVPKMKAIFINKMNLEEFEIFTNDPYGLATNFGDWSEIRACFESRVLKYFDKDALGAFIRRYCQSAEDVERVLLNDFPDWDKYE